MIRQLANKLELRIFDRDRIEDNPDPEAAEFFIRSYLGLRVTIGLLAFTLPYFLILFDWFFLDTHDQIRGSMSAYYHSPARDLFVGGLLMVGAFLLGYMNAKPRTWDFWLSAAAGVLVIIVAFFPTGRDPASYQGTEDQDFAVSQESCDVFPGPPDCNDIQNEWGEAAVRVIHQASAGLFVVLLACLCLVFALREFGYGRAAKDLLGPNRNVCLVWTKVRSEGKGLRALWSFLWNGPVLHSETDDVDPRGAAPARTGAEDAEADKSAHADDIASPVAVGLGSDRGRCARRVVLYVAMGALILLAGIWALLGWRLPLPFTSYTLGSTYVGEVIAFTAFGVAWLAAGKDLKTARAAANMVAHPIEAVTRIRGAAR